MHNAFGEIIHDSSDRVTSTQCIKNLDDKGIFEKKIYKFYVVPTVHFKIIKETTFLSLRGNLVRAEFPFENIMKPDSGKRIEFKISDNRRVARAKHELAYDNDTYHNHIG